MVTPEMLSYIKQQLSSGKTAEEIKAQLIAQGGWTASDIAEALHAINKEVAPIGSVDPIEKAIKVFSRYLKTEVIVIIVLICSFPIGIFLFAINPFFGILGAVIGVFMFAAFAGILFIVSLIGLVHGLVTNHRVKQQLPGHLLVSQYKKKYNTLLIFNCLMICLAVFTTVPYMIQRYTDVGRNAQSISEKERNAQDRVRYTEDEKNHLMGLIKDFKREADSAKDIFPKLSEVPNNGNCENPTPHSFFNPDIAQFTTTDQDGAQRIYYGPGSYLARTLSYFTFPKLGHCYSSTEHFAFDMPNYLENPYINFYCIDDMHPDIQINKKPIKGPSCEDLDTSYLPITRPVDTPITY